MRDLEWPDVFRGQLSGTHLRQVEVDCREVDQVALLIRSFIRPVPIGVVCGGSPCLDNRVVRDFEVGSGTLREFFDAGVRSILSFKWCDSRHVAVVEFEWCKASRAA